MIGRDSGEASRVGLGTPVAMAGLEAWGAMRIGTQRHAELETREAMADPETREAMAELETRGATTATVEDGGQMTTVEYGAWMAMAVAVPSMATMATRITGI